VCLVLGTLVLVGRSWSDSKPAPPAPRTRIAVLNLNYVIKYYKKFINFQEELKHDAEPYQAKDKAKTAGRDDLTKQLNDPSTPADKREELQKQILDVTREIEDNKRDAQKVIGKKQSEQLKILYEDVQDAAIRYARAHDFEMVLHYNDAITKEDYSSVANILRKLEQPACMPL
jgi:Skp family chaperone for outer membrane proteins